MDNDNVKSARPTFKHVQASGRGTQSEHEMAAKRAAVASIESRFDHNEKVRKSAARKRALANLGSIVIGLSLLAGVAYYFTHRDSNSLKVDIDFGNIAKSAQELLPGSAAPTSASETKLRDEYAAVAASFGTGELSHWKDAPKELKPKSAPAGTRYHVLIPRNGQFALYELKADGTAAELSPFAPALAMTAADFKKACGGKPFFIACAGRVFVCGGGDLKAMDELRKALLPR